MRHRIAAITAGLAASAVLLSGCQLLLPPQQPEPPTSTPTHEEVPAELEPYYTQHLAWESGTGSIDTTTVTVPLDWGDPTGDTIELAIARHRADPAADSAAGPAAGAPVGSLLVNPGGPGGSGFDFVHDYAAFVITPDVLDRFDVIGFDPRGVNRSTPVVCYTDPADQDELLYGTYDVPYGTEAWVEELTERETDWASACERNTGPLLAHLDAASVARDMDVIRAVLGDPRLNYLGYSYGTYLGTMYAELFPAKVGRMVLDGAVDPLVGDLDALATQMAGFDSALRAYLRACLGSGDCPFHGSVEDAAQQVRALIAGVDARRLTASDGRELDSATVGTGIAGNLYSQSSWSFLSRMFEDLIAGDADTAFASADLYNDRSANGTYPTNGSDVYAAVTCGEGTLGTDGVTPLEGVERIRAAAPILGDFFAYDDYAVLDAACSNWPTPVADLPTVFDAAGAAPILVIGTTNDPATPYRQAVSLAGQLDSGVLITYEGEGHTVYGHGVACVDDVVDAYLVRGVVPDRDPMC